MKKRLVWERLFAVLFALALWQIGSMALGQRLLLPSPVRVAERFCVLITEPGAWRTAAYSFFRIEAGFFLGLFTGCTLAALSAVFHLAEVLLWPFLTVIKAVPVASFIILALVWLNASGLSVFISFLMVLPVFYFNILEGIGNTDEKLLQAAEIFRMGRLKKLRYLYLQQIKPFFFAGGKNSPWNILESRNRGGGHRDSGRFHRRTAL